jgi:ubiquinone/menaquinone biosynthesis C-methylase UbiE
MTPKGYIDLIHRKMEQIISYSPILSIIGYFINKRMTINEFKMANLSDDTRFLCIGCGSFPWTLLILSSKYHCKCIGIDKDENAVKAAKRMVASFQLTEKIEIIQADALKYDVSNFDLISLSFGISYKEKILNNISLSMKRNGKILFRTPWELFRIIYGSETIPGNFKIISTYYRFDGIKSYLLLLDTKNK